MQINKKTSNIVLFFIIALSWSCGIWILLNPAIQKIFGLNLDPMLAWLGLIGPGLSAILVSIKENGIRELFKLFRPLFNWRVSIMYYLFVYVGVFCFYSATSWLSVLVYGSEGIKSFSWLMANVKAPFFNLHGIWIFIEITIIYTFCEELGWRGYALPKMSDHLTGLSSAVIIGFFWTLWHLPLIYLYGASLDITSTIIYFFHIEAFSIIYTWLFFKTNKSLLLVGLLHGATDSFWAFFPMISSTIGQGPNLPTVILEVFVALLMAPCLWKTRPSLKSLNIG